jgi:hypothetical protein
MKGTLVDSNVLLDVLTEDPRWGGWPSAALERCADGGPLFINAIVYAEVSIGFETIEEFEEALPPESFRAPASPPRGGVRSRQGLPALPPPQGNPNLAPDAK